MAETLNPATTVTAAFNAVNPNQALLAGDLRYVDFTEWRSPKPIAERLAREIERTAQAEPTEHVKILFTGHKGSGKSTELRRLADRLGDRGFFVVFFDAATEIDMSGVSYADVLLSTMYQLVSAINDSDIAGSLNAAAVDSLLLHLSTITVNRARSLEIENTAEAGGEVSTGIPGLFKVLARLNTRLRGGASEKSTLRTVIDGDIGLFLEKLNDLVQDLQIRLRQDGSKGLVILVDSLDRVILKPTGDDGAQTTHKELFIDHADHLMSPACSMVYTIPVSLLNNQNVANAWGTRPEVLPMVKVRNEDGSECEGALDAMVEAVARRIDIDTVFADPNDVRELCRMSGGHLRDLMILLREACSDTDDGDRISSASVALAIQELVNTYERTIEDGDTEALVEVYRTHQLPNREDCSALPLKLLVLEYRNGRPWSDVHPAVQQTTRFQSALDASSDDTA